MSDVSDPVLALMRRRRDRTTTIVQNADTSDMAAALRKLGDVADYLSNRCSSLADQHAALERRIATIEGIIDRIGGIDSRLRA